MLFNLVIHCLYFLLLMIISSLTSCKAVCTNNLFVDKNNLFALSDFQIDARQAEEICQASGGLLAQVSSRKENENLFWRMEEVYTNADGLANISVYKNPENQFLYKYSTEDIDKKYTRSLSSWIRPSTGELSSFKLFRSKTENFTEQVQFCFSTRGRDLILNYCVPQKNGWYNNFQAYGGNASTPNTIMLYQYRRTVSGQLTAKLLLSNNQPVNDFVWDSSRATPIVYLADISVFVGARSDNEEENWLLNDETVVNDPNYPSASTSTCQQISWPLTYIDGINLLPKRCENDQAFFACQYTDTKIAIVKPVPCNGSVLQLSWNAGRIYDVVTSLRSSVYLQVEVRGPNFSWKRSLSGEGKPNIVIPNLQPRTSYNITIELKENGCESTYALSTFQQITSFGIPLPVTTANVRNKTSSSEDCVIEWIHQNAELAFLSYVINVQSLDKMTTTNVSLKSKSLQRKDKQLSYAIDLSDHGYNKIVNFKILAGSCEGNSMSTTVIGTCLTPPPPPDTIPVTVIAAAVASLLLVILVLIGVILYRRKRYHNPKSKRRNSNADAIIESPNDEDHNTTTTAVDVRYQIAENQEAQVKISSVKDGATESSAYENEALPVKTNEPSAPIIKDNLEKTYIKECKTGFTSLHAQFKKLAKYANSNQNPHTTASNPANKKLNRYKNIYPYDDACVTLPGNRYINASYIEGYKRKRRYIATQGPKNNTAADFWEMIWQEKSSIIVMLCNCVEKKKIKCEMYWPKMGSSTQYGNIHITNESEVPCGDFKKRNLEIQHASAQEIRKVVQFHFTSWPDHDVPQTTSGMFYLRQHVNRDTEADSSNGPIVVHCSAGAGRTGAYIAIDNVVEEIHGEGKVDVVQVVLKMRKNRKDMVQNENQFVFVHKLLVEDVILPKTNFARKELTKFTDNPDREATASKEFKHLCNLAVITPAEVFEVPSEDSVYQNSRSATQYFANQVIFYSNSADKVFRMDAFHVTNGYYPGSFIASTGPRSGEENEFWEMVVRNNSCIVVSLEDEENDSYASVERSVGAEIKYDTITIRFDEVNNYEYSLVQKLTVSSTEASKRSLEVTYVHVRFLPSSITTPSVQNLIEVIEKIKTFMEVNQDSTAVVYCRYGCTRTGFLLCMANIVESLKHGNKIDVFRTVKDLRDMRPGILETLEMYKQCYQLIDRYLQELS